VLTCFRTSWLGKIVTQNSVWAMEKVGFVPKGTYDVGEQLRIAGDTLVKGGQIKIFTPMMLFVAQKVSVRAWMRQSRALSERRADAGSPLTRYIHNSFFAALCPAPRALDIGTVERHAS
jgi:hypothetical protein